MAAEGDDVGVAARVPDPVKHFQDWFKQEIEKREQLNRDLQAELDRYKQRNAELQARLDARDALDATSHASKADDVIVDLDKNAPVSYTTYSKLREQQEITWKSLKVSHQAMERYKAKYQKAKDSIRPWQEYARRCEQRLASKTTAFSTPEWDVALPPLLRPSVGASDFSPSRPSSCDAEAAVKMIKGGRSPSSSIFTAGDGKEQTPMSKSPSKLRSTVLATSHGQPKEEAKLDIGPTEIPDEPAAPIHIDSHHDSLARAHSLKGRVSSGLTEGSDIIPNPDEARARSTSGMPTAHENLGVGPLLTKASDIWQPHLQEGSPFAPIHIKSEPNSSPILHTEDSGLTRTSTFDLDESGTHITTPRKLRRMQTLLHNSSSFSRSFPPPGAGSHRSVDMIRAGPSVTDVARPKDDLSRPLQLLSPIRNDHPRHGPKVNQPTARKRKHHPSEEVASTTKDGDGIRSSFRPVSPSKKMKADHAIQALLDDSTPVKRALITPAMKSSARLQIANPYPEPSKSNDRAKTNELTAPSKISTTPKPSAAKPRTFKDPPPGPLQTHSRTRRLPYKRATALRQRPIEDLKPEDFKLNPAAHGKLNIEAMEPARSHADRRHLRSCTDPSCATCGSALRAIAKDMPITLGSSLFASTQDDTDEHGNPLSDAERILKYHLGATFSLPAIRAMPAAERNELVLTAKTHIVAERYGRHRLRPNARAKSPPGYWDVDMPKTQDMEERAREVERRERETVRERYREAMRKNGRWIFKDE